MLLLITIILLYIFIYNVGDDIEILLVYDRCSRAYKLAIYRIITLLELILIFSLILWLIALYLKIYYNTLLFSIITYISFSLLLLMIFLLLFIKRLI